MCLAEYPHQAVSKALIEYAKTSTSGFAPEPAHLIQLINKTDGLTEMEAWSKVKYAICHSAYNADKEWEKLPPEAQAMYSPQDLQRLATTEGLNLEVEGSNFMRSYKVKVKTVNEQKALGVGFAPKQIGG